MPEIADGLVEIQNVAREPGYRSKIAVVSHASGVDPVGACVGPRGSRVRMVVSELRGEKIDIIPFNEEPARFVAKALSPARVREVLVDDEDKQATVIVPDDQLSLAIGKEGQNARLAARLTGWRVDIRSETEFAEEEVGDGLRGGGGLRPLRGDPRERQALPERLAPGLALLRPARPPGARPDRPGAGESTRRREGAPEEPQPRPGEVAAEAPAERRREPPGRPARGRAAEPRRRPSEAASRGPRRSCDGCGRRPTARAGSWSGERCADRRRTDEGRLCPDRSLRERRGERLARKAHRVLELDSMAKKRVHEIAKEKGISRKEVLAILQEAGFDVKAAASSVDEDDVAHGVQRRRKGRRAAEGRRRRPTKRARPRQPRRASGSAATPRGPAARGAQQRPPRSARARAQRGAPGENAAGRRRQAGRRRRVVIDSQASRRQPGPPPPAAGAAVAAADAGAARRGSSPTSTASPSPTDVETPVTPINSGATVKEVAESLGLSAPEVIKKLMELGEMATLTQTLSDEAIEVLADAFEKKVEIVHAADEVDAEPATSDADGDLVERPPVVTIMGHVDHGKTSLLDAIRETEVAAGEAGGITQHIGAYQVHHGDNTVTFLDTPGHEAFTAMRARGAKVTDIAVIVVAADDGVMPQTVEAIDHAKAAGVPIMVAVNKIDKEGADPNRVRGELAQQGLTPADWGGDTEFVDVSAKTRENLDELLETLDHLADIQELKANPDAEASGVVIESRLDPGRGPVVSMLIQRGTLKVGDALVAGGALGPRPGACTTTAASGSSRPRPGEPVEVLGFDGVPEAGEHVRVVYNEREARQLAGERANRLKTEALARRQGVKVSLEDVFDPRPAGRAAELNLIVKADVAGSLEALADEIAKLPQEQVT